MTLDEYIERYPDELSNLSKKIISQEAVTIDRSAMKLGVCPYCHTIRMVIDARIKSEVRCGNCDELYCPTSDDFFVPGLEEALFSMVAMMQ